MDRGLLDDLKDLLQERISFSESVRNNHAKGEDCLLYTSDAADE